MQSELSDAVGTVAWVLVLLPAIVAVLKESLLNVERLVELSIVCVLGGVQFLVWIYLEYVWRSQLKGGKLLLGSIHSFLLLVVGIPSFMIWFEGTLLLFRAAFYAAC